MQQSARKPFHAAAMRVTELFVAAFDAAPWLHRFSRCWPIVSLATCLASVVHDLSRQPIDTLQFSTAGRLLWSAGWRQTFSDPWLQTGAAQLTLYGWASSLDRLLALPANITASLIIHVGVGFGMVGLVALPHRVLGRRTPTPLLLCAALAGWLLSVPSELYLFGHPAQFAITALWVLGGVAALQHRPAIAGLSIALASAWEPWGVLGAPLLLVLPGWRQRFAAAVSCTLGALLVWGPFVVLGDFAMHDYQWRIRPASLLAPLLGVDAAFPWQLRLLQGGIALTCGAAAACGLQRTVHVIWAVPLAAVAPRLIFDPMVSPYYWSPVKVLALVAVASFLALGDERAFVVLPLLYPVLMIGLVPHWLAGVGVLVGVAHLVRAEASLRPREVSGSWPRLSDARSAVSSSP